MAANTAAAHGGIGCARRGAEGKQEAALLWKLLICSGGTKTTKQSCALLLGFHGKVTAKPLEILWVCFSYN